MTSPNPSGKAIHPDEWFTEERCKELSTLKLNDAIKVAQCSKERLLRFFDVHGLRRKVGTTVRAKFGRQDFERMKDWYIEDIADETGYALSTIIKLFSRYGIKRSRKLNKSRRNRWLKGTREPLECSNCNECEYEDVCRVLDSRGLPILGEGLVNIEGDWMIVRELGSWIEKSVEEVVREVRGL